ncbi:hypothetical protein AB0N38_12320 [Micromonospora aurantiaca]|uniref:Uncharacterized protein n=1 Tax=Micromonospora aurantiaca (nom. illeg.) TaxID=47850 RepID=A0A1C6TBE9_9ACTN|nr:MULTISPECIES: hypothetical protein [Micromonospora]ADL43743.1 hypothetical protein Micau_0174 [Micromonospora aurantiaca ATCC 27029]ADU05711.1 hypothetical protein ML5_0158 [Micromonospora sp. L5]AXH90016.1 hypothetical protein DVH21_08800 [Micromonospora aurantiaca]OHX04869.1 hypothetical protein BFV98_18705 [Micromonospora sp. WMMB235]RNI02516.1 hypothetical protein EEZ25_14160 [Micromonospora aurantiaca]
MVDAPGTPPRTRPGVVTLSSWLLILVAAIQVLNLIVALTVVGKIRDVLTDAYAGTSAEGAGDIAYAFSIITAVVSLLIAAGLVVLALLNNRGKNGSRITTWVLGGILFCCTGGGLLTGLTGGMTGGGNTTGDVPSSEEIQRRLEDALPSWYTPVNLLLGLVALLALLAALILLALPKANEFFRKPKAGWEPPVPGGAYPAYPSHPGQSGDPAYPSYPPAPGTPPSTPGGQPPSAPGGQPPSAPGGQPGERRDPEPPSGS